MEEQTKSNAKKSEKRLAQEAEKMRKGRILLRKVDGILKSRGSEAALKALMKARLQMPNNSIVGSWFKQGYARCLAISDDAGCHS